MPVVPPTVPAALPAGEIVKAANVGVPFRTAFLTLVVATVLFLAIDIWLSVGFPKPDDAVSNLIEGMDWAFKLCLGALIGLLGGKVAT